jgi:transcriptional regulator with XRE-family HTH domain
MHLTGKPSSPYEWAESAPVLSLPADHPVSLGHGQMPIGFLIRRLRELKGFTQSQLAAQSEINLSHVCTVESGFNNISIKKLLLICNALRIPPALLMAMQQNMTAAAALAADASARGGDWPAWPFSALEYEAGGDAAVQQTEPAAPACSLALPAENDPRPDAVQV